MLQGGGQLGVNAASPSLKAQLLASSSMPRQTKCYTQHFCVCLCEKFPLHHPAAASLHLAAPPPSRAIPSTFPRAVQVLNQPRLPQGTRRADASCGGAIRSRERLGMRLSRQGSPCAPHDCCRVQGCLPTSGQRCLQVSAGSPATSSKPSSELINVVFAAGKEAKLKDNTLAMPLRVSTSVSQAIQFKCASETRV